MTLKTIKLSGSLGRRFGVFHKLAVDSYPEAIRALSSQIEGFKDYMQSEVGSRMRYAVIVDGKEISQPEDRTWQCAKEIRIIPIPTGSKSGGLFQSILGVTIMAVAVVAAGGVAAMMASSFASSAFLMGGAMALGGVTQMLSPQPGGAKMQATATENKPSYAFGGAVNTSAAGYPLPIPYGLRTVGGAIWSAGSYAEDKA